MYDKTKAPDVGSVLYQAISLLQTPEECYAFFRDLCTVSELKAMEQRFQVAGLLSQGRIYSEIVEATGASSATISRVNRCLHYGENGYRTMLDRIPEDRIGQP